MRPHSSDAAESTPPEEQTPFVMPHRGAAVLGFSLAGAGCFAFTVVAWLLIRAGLVTTEAPDGELLLVVSLVTLVAHVVLCLVAWAMAANDLGMMARGRMDPAGKVRTVLGKAVATILVLVTVVFAIAAAILVLSGHGAFTLEPPAEGS